MLSATASYDGLIDVTHGCTGVTVSNSKLSNHYKTSLVGAADTNTEDINATITYANNYWLDVGSRGPSLRFGHGHIFNNYYQNMDSALNTRVEAQTLVENNVFSSRSSETSMSNFF
jgi:pectate lyase